MLIVSIREVLVILHALSEKSKHKKSEAKEPEMSHQTMRKKLRQNELQRKYGGLSLRDFKGLQLICRPQKQKQRCAKERSGKHRYGLIKTQEDQILKEIYEVREIKRWSQIARIMEREYQIQGRNGKQCRQRYHNHLKGGINKEKWTPQEENDLIELHSQHGNRWALISKLIPGRSQNCVKNMLYSRMRRSVRLLNRFIFDHYRKQLKDIKISFIYRLIDFTEKSYKKQEGYRNQQEQISIRLKNDLLMLDYNEQGAIQEQKDHLAKLIEDIHTFKRINQRYRGNTTKRGEKIATNLSIDKKISDTSIELKEDQNEGSFKNRMVPEKPTMSSLDYLLDQHCAVTKVSRLDSLDGDCSFLLHKESCLERAIPLESDDGMQKEIQLLDDPLDEIERANNWQAYFVQFD